MAIYPHDVAAALAIDYRSVETLRAQAQHDPQRGLKAAARQFEALFMNMLLKSMREASPRSGLSDNEQTRLYTSLLDQQLAQTLSSRGVGLAALMMRQLSRGTVADVQRMSPGTTASAAAAEAPAAPPESQNDAAATHPVKTLGAQLSAAIHEFMTTDWLRVSTSADDDDITTSAGTVTSAAQSAPPGIRLSATIHEFMSTHWPHARAAAEATGIPPQFLLAQAALETGWGRHEIRGANGAPSYNLFGIKAGRGWSGPVMETVTTEYIEGRPHKTTERFRAYRSYAESFLDYANLLLSNPRYAGVRGQQDAAGFAYGLQRAGYATDPSYADKLLRILNGIGASLGRAG